MVATGHAASLYWDGSSAGPDADGGDGSWNTAAANWDTAATAGAQALWTDGSDAVFGGTGGVVTVSGTVTANSLTFNSQNYRITGGQVSLSNVPVIGTGSNDVTLESVIAGTLSISKTGTGTLTLSGANTFTKALTISEGTVKAGNAAAFGVTGSSTAGTTISSGATLDINGQSLGGERFTVSGTGVGGAGAIVNTGATSLNAIQVLTLAGPTSIGGPGHWSIPSGGSLVLSGHTLTKIGAYDVVLSSTVNAGAGHIDIKEGSFWFFGEAKPGGTSANTITARNGAMFGLAGNLNPRAWTAVFESGSTWRAALGNTVEWDGPVTLAGAATFDSQVDTSMRVNGVISGSGSFTKTGPGTWTLRRQNTYSGGTTVDAGKLVLGPVDTGGNVLRGAVTVNQGGTLTLNGTDVLGTTSVARVSTLNITGGTVDNDLNSGSNSAPVINLTGGALISDGGRNSPTGTSLYTMKDDAVINGLAAATPSTISGRIHLGAGNLGNRTVFNIADGAATEDLRIRAAITGSVAGSGIYKTGAGTLSLYGPATFTGPTGIEAGMLLLDGSASSLEDSVVVLGSTGARFGTMVPGKSLKSVSASSGTLVLPALPGGTTVVKEELILGAGVFIAPLIGADTPPGTYDLITAGSITGGTPILDTSGSFGASRATGSVVVNGNKLQLILTGTGSGLTWNNASAAGAANGTWDLALANFSDGAGNDTFHAFDSVTFNDSVAPGGAKAITLGTTLAPAQVTVNNSDGDYTFSAPGRLVGVGSLVKTGPGKLTVAGGNTYGMSGPIIAGGGVLDFAGKSIAASSLVLKSGAALNNTAIATNGALVTGAITAGTVELQSGSSNARLVSSGPWSKTTVDTVALTGGNSLSGPGAVTAGHLTVGEVTTRDGSIGSGPVAISSGAAVTISRGGPNNSPSPTIFNSFSGSGGLNFIGPANAANGSFTVPLSGDSSALTGPVSATNATLSVNATGRVGSGPISLTGRGGLSASDATLPNAITLIAAGSIAGGLGLTDSTLTGPITLPGGVTTTIGSYSYQGQDLISGPIGEAGGPANVFLNTSTSSTVTFSGASTYSGTTGISGGGVVKLTGSLGATAVTVNGGSALGGNGTIGTGGSLTFAYGSNLKAGTSGGGLTVRGDVTLGELTKVGVDVWPDAVASGPIPVLNYTGTLTGGVANLVIDVPSYYRKAEFAVTPGLITLDIGSKVLVWKGTNVFWDSTTVQNWGTTDAGAATDFFFKGDSVVFNDSGPGGSVSWGGQNVEPSSVVVDNNTKNYTITVPISGACSVIKRGTGSLALSGSDTYTGGTTVEAGRLQITGSRPLGYGPVSIAAAGTLAGDGTISGSVTLAGTLDPGLSSDSLPHTLSTGPAFVSGNYLCQLDTSSSDKLAVTGNLNLTGSTLTLNKTAAFMTPATWVIASYTGTLTGSFTAVNGMPAGYGLKYDTAGKQILVTRVNYADWIAGYPGLSDTTDSGDPDGDGVQNLVEYVVGGNPGASDAAILPTQAIEGDKLVFRYKRNDSSVSTTTQTVQWSPDMVNWTDIPISQNSLPPVIITPNGDLPDDVKVSITRIPGSMYVRLKVVQL